MGTSRASEPPAVGAYGRCCRTTTSVDTPFQNPVIGDVIEVTDLRHALFGQRFAVVSVSRPCATGGYVLVAYQGRMQLRLPVAATSLALRLPDRGLSKLTVEAVEDLIALAGDSEVLACSSDLNAFGDAPRGAATRDRSRRRRTPCGGDP